MVSLLKNKLTQSIFRHLSTFSHGFHIQIIFNIFSFIHDFPVKDPCLSVPTPCSNGGTCQVSPDNQTISCLCSDGYSGPTCLIQTDPCQHFICPENSECRVDPDPLCFCIPGYNYTGSFSTYFHIHLHILLFISSNSYLSRLSGRFSPIFYFNFQLWLYLWAFSHCTIIWNNNKKVDLIIFLRGFQKFYENEKFLEINFCNYKYQYLG